MSMAKRLLLILLVLVSCVGCDQASKSIARSILSYHERWSYIGDTVRLQLAYNRGAFLSMGASLPDFWRHWLLIVGVGCMLLCLLGYALFSKSAGLSSVLAAALILGGGFSNLADRIAYDGCVVDFINLGIGPVRTGIFNMADVAITAGFFILMAAVMSERKKGSG